MNKTALLLFLILFATTCWQCRWNLEEVDFIAVTTGDPQPLNAITLTVPGQVEGLVNGSLQNHGHVWSATDPMPTINADSDSTSLGPRDGNGEFLSTIDVDRLASGQEYFFRAYAYTGEGPPVYSEKVASINTGSLMISTEEELAVNIVTYIFQGEISDLILGRITEYGHIWSTAPLTQPTLNDSLSLAGISKQGERISNGTYFSIGDSLAPSTEYFVRAYAILDTICFYGDVRTFESGTIEVTTDRLTINENSKAEAIGTINNLSILGPLGYKVIEYGHLWTIDGSTPSIGAPGTMQEPTENVMEDADLLFSSELGGAISGVLYRVRSYAILDGYPPVLGPVLEVTFGAGFWEQMPSLPGPAQDRQQAVAFSLQEHGYVCAGETTPFLNPDPLSDLFRFDPDDEEWTMRNAYDSVRTQAVAFVINDDAAYVGTGWDGTAFRGTFRRFTPSNTWNDDVDSLPVARGEAVAFSVGGKGYAGLGANDNGLLNDFYVYDPEADMSSEWALLAFPFPGPPRVGAIAFNIGGKGYVGLGWDGNNVHYKDFYEFDPNSGWIPLPDLPVATGLRDAVAFSLDNGKGYVAFGSDGTGPRAELWEFDPSNDSWTQLPDFPLGGRTGAVGFGIDNQGFIGTGNSENGLTRDLWRFLPN